MSLLRCIHIFYVLIINVFIIVIFTFHRNFLIEPKIALHFFFVIQDIVGFISSYFTAVISFISISIHHVSLGLWYAPMHFWVILHAFISKSIIIRFWILSTRLFYFSMRSCSILIFINFLFECSLFLTALPSHRFFSRFVHLTLGRNFSILTSNLLVLEFVHLSPLSSAHNYLFIAAGMYFFVLFSLILFLWILSFELAKLFLARLTALIFCILSIFRTELFTAILFAFIGCLLCYLTMFEAILFTFICPLNSFSLLAGSFKKAYYFPGYSFDRSQ